MLDLYLHVYFSGTIILVSTYSLIITHKNKADFCAFILYYATLLNSLINSRLFCFCFVNSLGFPTWHLQTRTILFHPFWSVSLLFSCLVLLHSLELPAPCGIRAGILVLLLILGRDHSVFHFKYDVNCRFLYMLFIKLSNLSIPCFLRLFIRCWILSNASLNWVIWSFTFSSLAC